MIEKNSPTRERLIAEGLKALILQGFDGIGLNSILHSAGVPKGIVASPSWSMKRA